MDILAKYAKIAQNNNMVPIVEPEALINGVHDIHRAHEVSTACLSVLFEELEKKNVLIEGCILKPSMVTPGMHSEHTSTVEEVARMTIDCLKNNVPDSLPGITFLSGGQTELEATEHLNAMNQIGGFQWKLSFSYGRALQQSALKAWQGLSSNKEAAQQAFSHRAKMNKLAALGQWNKELETK